MALPVKGNDVSLREELEHIEKEHGIRDPLLDSVVVPDGLEELWIKFWQLYGGEGRLTYGEIVAFQRVTGWRLAPWHVDALIEMDRAARAYMAERMKP